MLQCDKNQRIMRFAESAGKLWYAAKNRNQPCHLKVERA
jgi:hypothetical protein